MKRRPISNRRRHSQGGYALLMIFLMAAIVAIMLYQQLPRVAFESEREKEQLLIDRGEQYTRAIQLYYLANNRQYPTSIDDLEKREKRFLRRRFVDPFTGKDEWRIIHTNGAFLTDSLVQKPPTDSQGKPAGNTTNAANNTNSPDEYPQVNAAVLQRPSDRPVTPTGFLPTGGVQPDPSGQQQPNTPLPPITLQPQQGALPPITLQPGLNQPGGLPPITLAPIGAGGQQNTALVPNPLPGQNQSTTLGTTQTGTGGVRITGTPGTGTLPGGIPGIPPGFMIDANGQLLPATPTAGQSTLPGQTVAPPGQSGFPGQGTLPGLSQGIPGQAPGVPGQPFTPQPPTAAGPVQGSPSAALTAINQLLTTPRQINPAPSAPAFTNQIGAIAGIASTYRGPSIKVYKDQQQYQMWEFVFNPTANTIPGGGPGGPGGTAGMGQGGPGQPGGPGRGAPSTFAPSGTFGPSGQSGLGNGPGR